MDTELHKVGEHLLEKRKGLLKLQQAGLETEVWVGIFSEDMDVTYVLSPALMKNLGDLGVKVLFDSYLG